MQSNLFLRLRDMASENYKKIYYNVQCAVFPNEGGRIDKIVGYN